MSEETGINDYDEAIAIIMAAFVMSKSSEEALDKLKLYVTELTMPETIKKIIANGVICFAKRFEAHILKHTKFDTTKVN